MSARDSSADGTPGKKAKATDIDAENGSGGTGDRLATPSIVPSPPKTNSNPQRVRVMRHRCR
ncbi:MAG: hypothetical protein WDM80_17895 [Limisphaerales bacterium]